MTGVSAAVLASWPVPGRLDAVARARGRWLAWAGVIGVAIAALAIGLLHVLPPSSAADPMSRTISEYSLYSDGWVFDAGVLVLAASSVLVAVALVLTDLILIRSWALIMLATWCLGLVGLIAFPKHGFGADATLAGRVHWTWTLIAFFSLPIGAGLACWRRTPGLAPGRCPRWAVYLSCAAAGWFVILAGQTALGAMTAVQTWRYVGLVERALSLTEMVIVVVLAAWVLTHTRPTSRNVDAEAGAS